MLALEGVDRPRLPYQHGGEQLDGLLRPKATGKTKVTYVSGLREAKRAQPAWGPGRRVSLSSHRATSLPLPSPAGRIPAGPVPEGLIRSYSRRFCTGRALSSGPKASGEKQGAKCPTGAV